ncbi:MAG: alkaline phosphatase family protein, partial [Candidatus Latescibacteria bacterium]|nr:alkaline phosphatase family protein [Candidatus Latescibacterota bacterium]
MNLFRRSRTSALRAIVLGLDGVPHSLLRKLVEEGRMPSFSALLDRGSLLPISSVLPTVSSVAWASIVTGCNPGRHNIFGFIDRLPRTHEMFIPNARHLRAKTWVELFGGMGGRVFSMGVPSTYPPKAVNGVLISGFLAPSLERATYPLQVAAELESRGYVIDIDAWEAHEDKDKFLNSVFQALDRRCDTMFHYLGQGEWDLFVAHLIDTDRLHHFLWGEAEGGHAAYLTWFHRFYERIDAAIGELADRVGEEVLLVVLSDHGFCRLRQEVHLNTWLREAGYLHFASREPKQLLDLAPTTRCYSLLPGRFYIC